MTTPRTAAGRDFGKRTELRFAVIDAIRANDPIAGIKAFDAYDSAIEAEARAAALDAFISIVLDESWMELPTGIYIDRESLLDAVREHFDALRERSGE